MNLQASVLSINLQASVLSFASAWLQVAGAAAAAGLSLEEVAAEAKCASEMVGTMGVAFSLCKLLGPVTSDRLGQKKMELGLGIVCYFLIHFPKFA